MQLQNIQGLTFSQLNFLIFIFIRIKAAYLFNLMHFFEILPFSRYGEQEATKDYGGNRTALMHKIGQLLHSIAHDFKMAIIVTNQMTAKGITL